VVLCCQLGLNHDNETLEEVLDFIARTENIIVINILLTLNPKHNSYSEHNLLNPS